MPPSARSRTFEIVEIPPGCEGVRLLSSHVQSVLDGGPRVALVPAYPPAMFARRLRDRLHVAERRDWPANRDHPAESALVLPTSGSTADPKLVILNRRALLAAAEARDAAQGGPSPWFVALPPVTAAAVAAVTRAVASRTALGCWTGIGGGARFDAVAVAAELERFTASADYDGRGPRISLVASQLDRLCDVPAAAGALARFDRVLIGGGPLADRTRQRAADLGIAVTATYGMTETAGGCFYDGHPTAGVRVALSDESEILLAGSQLTSGYLDSAFPVTADGFFRTGDRGSLEADGTLLVRGRFDEVVTVRGANVDLAAVARVVRMIEGVRDSAVVANSDASGGHRIRAYVVGDVAGPRIRSLVADALGAAAVPEVVVVTHLPRLPGGKVDVQRLRRGEW